MAYQNSSSNSYVTTRLSIHVFATITFDSKTLHANWLMAVPMTVRLGTRVSLTITSDATTFHPCKQQQIASGNKLSLVIL